MCAFSSKRLEQAIACVESVLAQRPRPAQVIVSVDHNDDLLMKLSARLPREVELVPNDGPRGLSSARNTALRLSCGDQIVFIDDDAVAHEQWRPSLLAAFKDPSVVGAGGHAVPAWEGEQPVWLPDEFLWVVGCEPSWLCWRLLALATRTELCLQIMVLEGFRAGGIRLRRSSRR